MVKFEWAAAIKVVGGYVQRLIKKTDRRYKKQVITSQVIKKTDAAAVILSAIQKLDSWLLQKTDLRDDDHAKLCSLRSEKKDLLVGMMEVWENDKFNCNYSSTNQDGHLVSLFFHGGGGLSDICWKHFEQLKVLDMEGFGLKILPETVGDLTGLRYLGLRNNYIQELPQSLCRLKMIEVLDIAQNFMVEVPDILWEMDGLRHLYMSDIICQKPLKIDALTNLETLTYITVDDWTYDVSDMKNKRASLCRLGIEEVDGNSNVSKLFASLAELRKLGCLILRGFRFRNMPSLDELGLLKYLRELKLEGRLTRLPSANNFPPKIWILVLVNSCLDEDPMPILEKLPDLSHLKLQNAYTGHEMVISRPPHWLVIRELWNLRNIVKVGESVWWSFVRYEIHSCPYLETVPQDIFSRLDPLRSQSLKCVTP